MTIPIPFTVIGGFLGAGKTTLLNHLLAGTTNRRLAVLVNDFGALDIDGRLVAAHGGDMIALANGCLCCTIGDSLVTTLLALLERPERPDHIVVEASGVADPGRIADLAVLEPRLGRDGVIVVVDGGDVRQRAGDRRVGDTVLRQLKAADLLILNKVDLVDDPSALRSWLAGRSTAPVVEARHGDVPVALLFGLDRHGVSQPGGAPENFRSWSYSWPEPVDRVALLAMLSEAPAHILRAKGIVRFADAVDRRSIVHMIGRRIDVTEDGPWRNDAESQLVLLGTRPMLQSLDKE
ncbi:GTP-binding protein [Enhydrobacter sp.]|jgi:G3E family GTPase|uniref:CobW family GTP-binding protein n=1 Tax=Enhydrobacter sp. TaxID=1894999 RepID=UPI0026201C3C|nr:GTP-binding protein [Enhydrobacter sp.]WIM09899.1 MAG: Metal chaperone, involved in Zn homeostasis [Enhydrobacter sp.]